MIKNRYRWALKNHQLVRLIEEIKLESRYWCYSIDYNYIYPLIPNLINLADHIISYEQKVDISRWIFTSDLIRELSKSINRSNNQELFNDI